MTSKIWGQGLKEARLSYQGGEYRLYFSHVRDGTAILLGLVFHRKGSQGAQRRAINRARSRLADALDRNIC